jgi:CelD/BcsL family acetyltransferase involved in cellulose biosynthesis
LRLNYSSPLKGVPASELTVQVIRSLSEVAELESDYADLQSVTGNALPFALFDWHLAWCRHFLRQERGVEDQPMFYVVRHHARGCVGIVPLILTRRRVGGLHLASATLLGADPAITEIRSSLVRPGCEAAVAEALHGSLSNSRDWDWIHWMGPPDLFSAALGSLRGLHWQPIPPSYVLDLPATWEEFRAGLKRNIRESLRHCYNSLKREGHAFTMTQAESPDEVRQALDRLFVLHASRSDMPGTTQHPNRFAGAGLRQFLQEVCGELAARDIVRVFQLTIGGQVVASRIGFEICDSLYLYYSGFDPAWSQYSVMTTTVAEAIKYAIGRGLKTVNLSPGNDVSKTRWGPREVPQQIANERSGRLKSRLVRYAYVKARTRAGLQGWLLNRLIPGRRNWD